MLPAAPALGDTHTLMELPRTPDLALSQRVVVAEAHRESLFSGSDTLAVGVSRLLVASYVLTPTPKMAWLYPLAPSTLVTSLDVRSDGPGLQIYAMGLQGRGKCRLHVVHKSGSDTAGSALLRLPKPAVAVKFAGAQGIYVLLADGEFLLANYAVDATDDAKGAVSVKRAALPRSVPQLTSRASTVEFHAFVPGALVSSEHDMLFYAVRSATLDDLTCRLVALNGARSFDVYQVSLAESAGSWRHACAYAHGMLYVYDPHSRSVSLRSLMRPLDVVREVLVTHVVAGAPKKAQVALVVVAANRLLLSVHSLMFLLDFTYACVLGEHTNNSGNAVHVAVALPAASVALYLNLDSVSRLCKLKLIHVDAGTGTLRECLGKALEPRVSSAWAGVPHIAEPDLVSAATTSVAELDAVFKKLTRFQSKCQTDNFDTALLAFLKHTRASKVLPRFAAADRTVDHRFIERAVSLVFAVAEDGTVQMAAEAFMPRHATAYLLSHPLFPRSHTSGLLELLSALDESDLLRQAIQHCAAVPLPELIIEFANLVEVSEELGSENSNDLQFVTEFLHITIDRILRDYSLQQITSSLHEHLTRENEDHKRLERMLNVLINVNSNGAWTFVQAVIDVGGLFNWTVPTILALTAVIDDKIAALALNSYNLTLTNQALVALELSHLRKTRKNEPKVVDNIHETTNRRAQLDALLTLSNNTTNRRLLADEGVELAKQIPTYSKEKLIF